MRKLIIYLASGLFLVYFLGSLFFGKTKVFLEDYSCKINKPFTLYSNGDEVFRANQLKNTSNGLFQELDVDKIATFSEIYWTVGEYKSPEYKIYPIAPIRTILLVTKRDEVYGCICYDIGVYYFSWRYRH